VRLRFGFVLVLAAAAVFSYSRRCVSRVTCWWCVELLKIVQSHIGMVKDLYILNAMNSDTSLVRPVTVSIRLCSCALVQCCCTLLLPVSATLWSVTYQPSQSHQSLHRAQRALKICTIVVYFYIIVYIVQHAKFNHQQQQNRALQAVL
jgi:hypothetical protein